MEGSCTFTQVDRALTSASRIAPGVGNGLGGGGITLDASFSFLMGLVTSLEIEPLCERALGAMGVSNGGGCDQQVVLWLIRVFDQARDDKRSYIQAFQKFD